MRQLADQIPAWLRSRVDLPTVIPVPAGFSFGRGGNDQLQRALLGAHARRYRRVFGYVGDIQLSVEARGATTPTQLKVVALIPWRYGNDTSREKEDSFTFPRINAFASKVLLTLGGGGYFVYTPIFAPDPAVIIRVGDPVSGFLGPSPGESKSAQLTGWGKTDVLTWQGASLETHPRYSCFSSVLSTSSLIFQLFPLFPASPWGLNPTTSSVYPICQRGIWCMRGRRALTFASRRHLLCRKFFRRPAAPGRMLLLFTVT